MSNDLIGLSNLSQMYFNRGNYYHAVGDYPNMEKSYMDAVELGHIQAMNRLALYYDDIEDKENMLKYYLLAIEGNDTSSMYNLARYYCDTKDYTNMIPYYLMAIELKDTDSCYELSIHYQNVNDIENMKKYYLIALEMEMEIELEIDNNCKLNKLVNDGFNDFNPFILLKMLESIENPNDKITKKLEKLNRGKEITIYNNKIRISKKLNHVDECIVCYETKLHINIYCGHCFCIDCYPNLFDKSCPLCRLSKNSFAFA
jgi:tetratricopeptide (TPR) repeat protein